LSCRTIINATSRRAVPQSPGAAEPSQADELITRRLSEALRLLDVRIPDHPIVGAGELTFSFAETGRL
jgi:DNA repair protein RadC